MKQMKFLHLILFGLILTSCGFHLRGNQDLSNVLPEVQLQGINVHGDLSRELKRALINAQVNVIDESETLLSITKNRFSKRVLSLDSAGRANQYELSYQLTFSLVKKVLSDENKTKQQVNDLVPSQTITQKREYIFDTNLVLAKTAEETQLNNDMRQSAILQLIRRLKFSMKNIALKSKLEVSK